MSVADWNALHRRGVPAPGAKPVPIVGEEVTPEPEGLTAEDGPIYPEPQGQFQRVWSGLGTGALQIGTGVGAGLEAVGNRMAAANPATASVSSGLGPVAAPLAIVGNAVGPYIESAGRNLNQKAQFIEKHVRPTSSLEDVVQGKVPAHEYLLENMAAVVPQMGAAAGIGFGAWAAGAPAGAATVAGGLFNYLLNTGDLYNTLRDRGVPADKASTFAGVAGVPIAALDTIYLKGLLKPKAINGFMRRVADGFVKEAFPEGGQELLAAATEWAAGVPDTVKNILWRTAGSLVIGGATGATGSAVAHRGEKRKETLDRLVESLGPLAKGGTEPITEEVTPEGDPHQFAPEGILKAPPAEGTGGAPPPTPPSPTAAAQALGPALGPAAVPRPDWQQVMGEDREKLFVPSMEVGEISNQLTTREQAKADYLIKAGAPELDAYSSARYGLDFDRLPPERQQEIQKMVERGPTGLPTQDDVPPKGVIPPTVEINKPPTEASAAMQKYGQGLIGEGPDRMMGAPDLQSAELREGPAPSEETAKAAMVEAYDNVYQAREIIREIQVKMDTATGEDKIRLSVQLEKARRMLAEADAMAIEAARDHQKMAREAMEERRAKERKEQADRISPPFIKQMRPAIESALNILGNSNSTDEQSDAAWADIAEFKRLAKEHNINGDALLQEWEDKIGNRDALRGLARFNHLDSKRPEVEDAIKTLADPTASEQAWDAAKKVMEDFRTLAQHYGEDADALLKDWATFPPGEGDSVYTQGPQDRQEFLDLLYGKGQVPGQEEGLGPKAAPPPPPPKELTEEEKTFFGGLGAPKEENPLADAQSQVLQAEVRVDVAAQALRTASPADRPQRTAELNGAKSDYRDAKAALSKAQAGEKRKGGGPTPQMSRPKPRPEARPDATVNWTDVLARRADKAAVAVQQAKAKLQAAATSQEKEIAGAALDQAIADWQAASQTLRAYDPAAEAAAAAAAAKGKPKAAAKPAVAKPPTPTAPVAPQATVPPLPSPAKPIEAAPPTEVPEEEDDAEEEARRMAERKAERLAEMAKRGAAPPTPTAPAMPPPLPKAAQAPAYTPPESVHPNARPTAPYVSHSSQEGVPPIVFQPIDLEVVRQNPLVAFGLDTTDAGTLGASLAQAIFEARTQAAARARISLAVEEARVKGLDGNAVAEAAIHLAQQIYPNLSNAEARQAAGPLTTAGPDRTVEKGTAAVAQALGISPKEAFAEARESDKPGEAINRVKKADKLAEILYAFNVDPTRVGDVTAEQWTQIAQAAGVKMEGKEGPSKETKALVTRLLHGKGKEDAGGGPQKMIDDEDHEGPSEYGIDDADGEWPPAPNPERDRLQKAQSQHNKDIVRGAWWQFARRGPGQSGTLYMNQNAMDILAHAIKDEAEGYSFDRMEADHVMHKLSEMEIKGLDRHDQSKIYKLRSDIADHIRKQKQAGDPHPSLNVVAADPEIHSMKDVKEGAKEERAHASQQYVPLKQDTVKRLMATPTFEKGRQWLLAHNYPSMVGPRFHFNEITAKVLVGNDVGLTLDEQLEVAEAYREALIAEHGEDKLVLFRYVKAGKVRATFYGSKAEAGSPGTSPIQSEGGRELQSGADRGREGPTGGQGRESGVSGSADEGMGREVPGGINPQKVIAATRRWLARRRMLKGLAPPGTLRDMSIGSWWLKQTKTIYQLAKMAPGYAPIQKLVKIMEGINNVKNWFLTQGEKVTKRWQELSDTERKDLTRYAIDVHNQSKSLGRRLTVAELAAQPIQLNPTQQALYKDTDEFIRHSIFNLQSALQTRIAAQQRAGGGTSAIDTDLQTVLNENYFPTIGFGEHIVWDDTTGEAFRFDEKGERDTKRAALDALGHTTRPDTLSSAELAFSGTPYKLATALMDTLAIDPIQKSRIKLLAAADSSHNVGAYDAERAIAQFSQRMGNFVSKTMYRGEIDDTNVMARAYSNTLSAAGVDNENATHMQKWIEEAGQHILNPTSRFNTLKALMFTKYFWMVPKQAAVNVTQLINTYSALSAYMGKGKRFGIGQRQAAVLMVKSMADIREMFNPKSAHGLSADEKIFLQTLEVQGLLDQTWAGNVAAVSHGSPIERTLAKLWVPRDKARAGAAFVRRTNDFGLKMFSFTEEFNRRFTALTAYRAAKLQGSSHSAATAAAANMVRTTQGVYDLANVPAWARGKANFMYVFRSYIQNQLHFYRHEDGGFQAFMLMSMLTGLMGMPFAENIADITDLLITKAKELGHYPEPKSDVRFWLQKYINGVSDGASEVIMHGASRSAHSLVDISGSVGMGNVAPTEGLTKGWMGSMDKSRALLRIAEDAGGVTSSGAMDLIKASMTQDPEGMSWLKEFLPKAVTGTMSLAQDIGDRQFQTTDGKKLVPINLYDSWSQAEILAKFLGGNPARVSRERDAKFAYYEDVRYYETRRELALNSMLAALKVPEGQKPDPKKVDAAIKALERFNDEAPTPFQWTHDQWYSSIEERMTNRAKEDLGFPLLDKYYELSEARRKAFGLPPAGEQEGAQPRPQPRPQAIAPEDAVVPMQ